MDITAILKKYKTFHLPEPIEYPSWIFDFEHDNPEKHADMSKWDKIKSSLSLKKSKQPVSLDYSNSMWVAYGFSPSVYSEFKSEIKKFVVGNNVLFSNFLKEGHFKSKPHFKIHIFRAVRLYKDNHDVLMGNAGRVHYFVMSRADYKEFSPSKVKFELNLDDITELNYKHGDL